VSVLVLCAGESVLASEIPVVEVHADQTIGVIPRIHGTVNGPLVEKWWRDGSAACDNYPNWWTADFTERFEQVDIPAVRPHGAGAIDINAIWTPWPSYDADVDHPANYDFTIADRFVASTIGVTDVIGRFGFSKGNINLEGCDWAHPPPPLEFAAVCGRIIAHFNQGWNWDEATWGPWHEGWRIGDWIVWNEPGYNVNAQGWWTGTPQEFAELYDAVVTEVKRVDPSVHIGPSMDKGDFGDGFFEAWATINPRPAIDHVDIHMYGDSPLQLPWQVYAAPPDDDGPANWEDYFESVGLPRSTPIILGEWSRRIPHYAVDGPGGAYIMCGLSLLADMAEQPSGLHHIKMACLFSVGKIWSGATQAPQNPTLGGVAMHVYGEQLAARTPNRLAVESPPNESKDVPTLTGIAGVSASGRRMALVVSQYDRTIPDAYGDAFPIDVVWRNLPGGPFQYARWSYLGAGSGVPVEVGFAQGEHFERLGVEMIGNSIEAWWIRYCPQDVNDSGETDADDLLAIVARWESTEPMDTSDVTLDGMVDADDLMAVLAGWGSCQ